MNWIYKGKEITDIRDLPDDKLHGFIYLIKLDNGQQYIGKKNFKSVTKKNFGKRRLATITDRRLKTYETITKESNWKSYVSSSKKVNDLIESGRTYTKEILFLAGSKRELTYRETEHLFIYNVLFDNNFINDNILGKFYGKNWD